VLSNRGLHSTESYIVRYLSRFSGSICIQSERRPRSDQMVNKIMKTILYYIILYLFTAPDRWNGVFEDPNRGLVFSFHEGTPIYLLI